MDIFIYGLVDPETFQIRYIGQTKELEGRLKVHISVTETNIRYKRKLTHKESWIISLLDKGLQPLIIELDRCNEKDWEYVEIWWINLCRIIKLPLTNLSNGGKGIFRGRHHTKEAIELIRNNKKGKIQSEETKQKQSEIRKGKTLSESHRRNIGLSKSGQNNPNYGKPRTEETKRKISQANKGRTINETWRLNMSLSHKGHKYSEEHKRKIAIGHKGIPSYWKGKSLSFDTRKKMSLSHLMRTALKQNNFEKIRALQIEYKNLFGEYYLKYIDFIY